MAPELVAVDVGSRAAFDAPALLPAGAIFVNTGGQACLVRSDGSLERLLAGGWPRGGAAADPANARRNA